MYSYIKKHNTNTIFILSATQDILSASYGAVSYISSVYEQLILHKLTALL